MLPIAAVDTNPAAGVEFSLEEKLLQTRHDKFLNPIFCRTAIPDLSRLSRR